MTGRRLYERYCDATAAHFSVHWGAWSAAGTALPAWPSLSDTSRRRWSDLARRITPKRRPLRVPAPPTEDIVLAARSADHQIFAIKELRSLRTMGLREAKDISDDVGGGRPIRLELPQGTTRDAARRILVHWTVA